jgi:hypothetical protein
MRPNEKAMFLRRQMPGFAKKAEKSPGIRAGKAPRGANSKNLRMNSRRLGQLKFAEKLHQGAAAQPLMNFL